MPPSALDGDAGAVHDVGHPQLARLLEAKAPAVVAVGLVGALLHQPGAREEPVDRRVGQRQLLGHRSRGARLLDDQGHRQGVLLVLDAAQQVRDRAGDAAGVAPDRRAAWGAALRSRHAATPQASREGSPPPRGCAASRGCGSSRPAFSRRLA